jgi:hypothetical protein
MAHTLSLTDGSVSIDLADTSGSGIYLSQFVPPSSDRKATRVGPAPAIYGQRTIASTMADTDAKITCTIYDTSANNVEAQLLALIRLLELARAWEENRTGSPVRLVWKRAGASNTAYWTITGVPQLPQPVGAEGWLDEENATNMLTIDMVLTLEPIAHAAIPVVVRASGAITSVAGSNTVTTAATLGDLPGPADVWIDRTSAGNDWSTVWIAQIATAPDTTDYSGTVDAAAYGGQGQTATYTSPTVLSFTGSGLAIDTSKQHPIRGFIRMKVTSAPTAGIAAVQVRMRVNFGTSTGSQWTGPWLPFAGTVNQYTMFDMGAIPVMSGLLNRGAIVTASYFVAVEMQSTDATTFTVRADYSTFFPYYGLVKLTDISLANGDRLAYDATLANAAFDYYMPRQDAQAYETNGGVLQTNATRAGRLARHPGGVTAIYWVQGQSTGLHQITDTAAVSVLHLPCYQVGMRGAG